MGLSIVVAGVIVMTTILIVMFSVTGILQNIFGFVETAHESLDKEKEILQTDIELYSLMAQANSAKINFTLFNDEQKKLWDFENFDVFVTYDTVSSQKNTETLTYEGDCNGGVPAAGNWCIESISGTKDPGIINEGQSAIIRTQVSQDLINGNPIVSVNTANGERAILPNFVPTSMDVSSSPPVSCQMGYYGRTFIDTDTGISYICDPSRDKWLSTETVVLWGDESSGCANGANPDNSDGCNVDWGNGQGPTSSSTVGLYIPYNFTIIGYGWSNANNNCGGGLNLQLWGTGSNTDDDNYSLLSQMATGVTGEAIADNSVNVDGEGDQFTLWGFENNCGPTIDDWAMIIWLKWHHDDP